ncbi:RsmD family RNA methyltransferase, partial [Patescibacteria group bacterium]|nr:RsmD family RNA methyltransferase [Patescibacteria group bacterium]
MHITSGIAKNRLISVPESAKPIKGIVLNSIFSTIGDEIKNKRCLDLFAGSGALGLEALSRGAKF